MAEKKQSMTQAARARAAQRAQAIKDRAATARGGASKHAGGFSEFVRTQGVVGLAVGLAIGTAAGDTVKKLVEGFINPIVQFIVGSQDGLQTAVWHFEAFGRSADFAWGAFVSSAITLLATALVIYWLVQILKLDRLDRKKD